jgi:DNA-binding MarR family transcriptional regulator
LTETSALLPGQDTLAGVARDPLEAWGQIWDERGWQDASLGLQAASAILRAQQLLLTRADQTLRPLNLTFARWEVLVLLDFAGGPVPLGMVASRLQMQPASVSNAVNRLEAERLVGRRPHPDDARVILAEITPKGRRVAEVATRSLNDEVFTDLGFSDKALDEVFGVLQTLRRAAGDF